jgi:hypothetical protein
MSSSKYHYIICSVNVFREQHLCILPKKRKRRSLSYAVVLFFVSVYRNRVQPHVFHKLRIKINWTEGDECVEKKIL